MTDLADLRAELRVAEERREEVRARSAQLERSLLKPAGLRGPVIATVALAMVGGSLAYFGAGNAGDARAVRERARSTETYDGVFALQRNGVNACKLLVQRTKSTMTACAAERDELTQKVAPLPPPPARPDTTCTCQPFDPLCSCF